jgi:hypothetical protein
MSASLTKKMVLGTVTGLVVMAAAMAPASAHKHGKHRHILRWSAPIVITRTSGCSFYYWKWQDTGRAYWKRKYVYCLGY